MREASCLLEDLRADIVAGSDSARLIDEGSTVGDEVVQVLE